MAQTRKRRRKHRGTQAGTIDRQSRTGQPRTRQEAKEISRRRRQARLDRPPTLKGALQRAAVAAVLFGVLVVVLFHRAVVQGALLMAFMFVLYIPLGYGTDKVIYNVRRRRREAASK
jgi:Flp pilus assembly protein TadB